MIITCKTVIGKPIFKPQTIRRWMKDEERILEQFNDNLRAVEMAKKIYSLVVLQQFRIMSMILRVLNLKIRMLLICLVNNSSNTVRKKKFLVLLLYLRKKNEVMDTVY